MRPSQHSAPEQAVRVLIEPLGLERQGHRTLKDIHPSLFAAYMKTR